MISLILRAKEGDIKAMDEIINENVGLVWSVVKRFSNRGYELEDLFQIGCMGFVKAVKKFDTSFDTQLSTYAVSMIIGEIRRFLRDDGMIKVSRSLKEIAVKVKEIKSQTQFENLTIDEIAKMLNLSKEEILMSLDATSLIDSLDKKIGEDADSVTVGERIKDNVNDYDNLLNKMTVNSLLDGLDEKEKNVIICRYYKDMTQGSIAKLYKTSQVQISRIEKKALLKMRGVIDN
jgi:RNA polymerase sporulation-specific sigma factor